jgi:hypothetical protein
LAAGIYDGHKPSNQAMELTASRRFTKLPMTSTFQSAKRLGFRITGSEQCVHGIRFVPMQRLSPNDRNA